MGVRHYSDFFAPSCPARRGPLHRGTARPRAPREDFITFSARSRSGGLTFWFPWRRSRIPTPGRCPSSTDRGPVRSVLGDYIDLPELPRIRFEVFPRALQDLPDLPRPRSAYEPQGHHRAHAPHGPRRRCEPSPTEPRLSVHRRGRSRQTRAGTASPCPNFSTSRSGWPSGSGWATRFLVIALMVAPPMPAPGFHADVLGRPRPRGRHRDLAATARRRALLLSSIGVPLRGDGHHRRPVPSSVARPPPSAIAYAERRAGLELVVAETDAPGCSGSCSRSASTACTTSPGSATTTKASAMPSWHVGQRDRGPRGPSAAAAPAGSTPRRRSGSWWSSSSPATPVDGWFAHMRKAAERWDGGDRIVGRQRPAPIADGPR